MYYYGARYYNPRESVWLSVDPLFISHLDGKSSTGGVYDAKNLNVYSYAHNSPVVFVDIKGEDVIILFNKETGQLKISDLDYYKEGLPTKFVSAKDYKHGGIRDKNGNLTHNQVLVIENVFSGGIVGENGQLTRDYNRNGGAEKPIPNGRYDLTEYEGGKSPQWYKLDPVDSSRYDDEHQGYTNSEGKTRSGYRLHLGGVSFGCITVNDPTKSERVDEWNVVGQILKNTSKTEVPKREGNQKYIPWGTRLKYGTVLVTGSSDKVKEIK